MRQVAAVTKAFGPYALIAWLAVGGHASAEPPARPGWEHTVIIDEPGDMSEMEAVSAFRHVTGDGVNGKFAASVLRSVRTYIDDQLAHHRVVTLSVGLLDDSIEAATSAKWSVQDTTRLVIALQREIDRHPRPTDQQLQAVIARVQPGVSPADILGASDTLKETLPVR
jgi:hypothetical protein